MSIFKRLLSFITPVPAASYTSAVSGTLFISWENGRKVLNTGSVNYSYNSLHRVFRTAFKRTDLKKLGVSNTLLLGVGGGSVIQILREEYHITGPIDAVDLDPVILDIARKEFRVERFSPLQLIQADASEFVLQSQESYDLICIDVFVNDTVPDKFNAPPFIRSLMPICRKGGRVYFNSMSELGCRELKQQFASLYPYLHTQTITTEGTNFVLVVNA